MRSFLPILLLASALTVVGADKKVIQPKEFAPGKPFSQGILVDGTLYVAGQTGADLKTGQIPDDFEAEVKTALDNIGIILREAKLDFKDVVSVQVFLTDMDLFPKMNGVYTTYFHEPRPVRTTVGVTRLVGKSRIEITVIAHK